MSSALRGPILGLLAVASAALAGAPEHRIPRAAGPVVIDAVLDEPAWSSALVIELGYETFPGDSIPAPVRSECLLAHDDEHLYVAFRAHDPEPGRISAHLTDRDGAFEDDFAGIVLDTFNDERRAYEFYVNPLGVQMDLVLDDIANNEDQAWDAIWDSAGRLAPEGYVVEFAIPFAQIRFVATPGEQTWGVDAVRIYPRRHRYEIHSQAADRHRACYLCQISKVRGFAGLSPGRNLELDPTLTALRAEERDPASGRRVGDPSTDVEPGLSARWGVTPDLTLNAALNPDFSQVEADAAQLDVNTQFALFYPEKRPFFLESADLFATPIQAVYTRTIADPDWAAKLIGKKGRSAFGAIVANDGVTNLLAPGPERSASDSLPRENTTGILRYRGDVGRGSALGALATFREATGYSNRVAGADGLLRLAPADTITFQLLHARTEIGSASGEGSALFGRFRHDSREWDWQVQYEDFGDEFRADAGFVPRVGYRYGQATFDYTWWGEPGDWYGQIEFGGSWDYGEDRAGNLLDNQVEFWTNANGPLQSFGMLGGGWRERSYLGQGFRQWYEYARLDFRPSRDLQLEFELDHGGAIDYANAREATRLRVAPELLWTPGRHARIELGHAFERLDVGEGRLYDANLTELRLYYHFSRRVFVRWIGQHTRVDRHPALYRDPVDARERRLDDQLLFSYKVNPQTVVFVGYSDRYLGTDEFDLSQEQRAFFLKLGYAWLM
ncbi:MAG: carbohydrate binding family 9 domain-containing protein [Acidobacteria bacterium]|nr:carbohydrate binding family 9 domain-containing protein [Acidobacteriota bacterium]